MICNRIQCALRDHWKGSCQQGNPFYNCFFVESGTDDSFNEFMTVPSVYDYVLAIAADGGDTSSHKAVHKTRPCTSSIPTGLRRWPTVWRRTRTNF